MDRSRGRGRGRGRGTTEQQPGSQGGQRPLQTGGSAPGFPQQQQPQRHVPAGQPQASAWGPRAQVQQQHQIRAPAPPKQQMQPSGRASLRDVPESAAPGAEATHSGVVSGGGDVASAHSGRGAVRGRRPLTNILKTKPEKMVSKKGEYGSPLRLMANYFKLVQKTDWGLFQYHVDFSPPENHTGKKKRLFRQAIKEILAGYIYDGTVMYAAQRLNPSTMELFVEDEGSQEKIRITVKMTNDIAPGDYQYIQFFNIIMRKCMKFLKLQLLGRNFFDPGAKVTIPEHKLELWPGYVTSIRQHETSVLMCCEITHKVTRIDTVLHLLEECIKMDTREYKKLFLQRIVGSVVLTDYNNRTYHVDDVDFSTTPESSFPKSDGSSITYIKYYEERYGLRIHQRQQPMLVSRAKAREIRAGMPETLYLVPELCRMTGLTDAQRANFQLMRALADHTRVGPGPRIDKLKQFSRRLLSKPEIVTELQQWDMKLADTLVDFAGRVLPPETILTSGGGKYSAGRDADWTKELRSRPMLHSPEMQKWYVICPSKFKQQAHSFMQMLIKAAGGMKWSMPMAKLHEIRDDRAGTYIDALETVLSNDNPTLILCVASNNKADRYSAIKKKCCVDRAVPTQVILAKNLDAKGAMSIATKVAIQINCKIGGAPWTVAIPIKSLMIVGFDVCHDTSQKNKSFGAMVATLDAHASRYFSVVTPHANDEELSNDIALNLCKACREFQSVNGFFPEKIIFYRDGVGDGQLPYVYQTEVQNIIKQLKETYYANTDVKLCFIVVSKRINTRVFTAEGNNPPPGTVVDDCITLPERYDFFIVSQCVRQGTVSPTSYNVLYDTMGAPADHIQRLTYKLTHMYYNWSGTVRVPAPCQYAHKLAFLTGQSLHREPKPELSRVLYYL